MRNPKFVANTGRGTKADVEGPWLVGSRIKRSNRRWGKPTTGPGIPALEDKIVQKAVAMILTAIYEQDFLNCFYGYRPDRGAKDAVSDLVFQRLYGVFGTIVEADIKSYFDTIDHD